VFAGGKSKVHDLAIHGAGMQTAGKTDCLGARPVQELKTGRKPLPIVQCLRRSEGSRFNVCISGCGDLEGPPSGK